MQYRIPAVFMRGGTSRAVCFREDALAPYDQATRERIILAALGSPDPYGRQIDGLGGGISSLSKVAIIGRSTEAHSDVTFTFGQVDVYRPFIDWRGTCGNISAAVGPFAIDEGLVPAVAPVTPVRVLATNTGKRYIAYVPVQDGMAAVEGDYTIDGVPAPGARITLEYLEPGGSLGGPVLPTGTPRQEVTLADGRRVTISLVDVAVPVVYVRAAELGADATRLAPELDADRSLQETLEALRCHAALLLGLAQSLEEAHTRVQAIPKIAMVAPPAAYVSSSGRPITAEQVDLVARAISMGNTHRTFPGTVSMCTAAAAAIPGTVVQEVAHPARPGLLRIGHPAGVMEVGARVQQRHGAWHVESVTTQRTARRIMEGYVLVPRRYLEGKPWFEG
ncbi:MAG: putative methylaconitate Delta-isomerase PrpF [Candidatus Tectimicrobiota bacterium]|nr:MAG: putative methylaconitate Delta-isomerase PrpF [Candidatus Tectomicrobia bacterium]